MRQAPVGPFERGQAPAAAASTCVSARLPLRFAPDISVRVETETVDGRKIAHTICVVSARHAARPPSA
jgi:hypothetical protein